MAIIYDLWLLQTKYKARNVIGGVTFQVQIRTVTLSIMSQKASFTLKT